ncbi:MAG: hypothetical protein JWN60_1319 [Acidobacteria bacterium]|jgi:phosphoglycolate phosphatase-like HAD superfamily hydrolase|nr:hypothetical protein [Acidobacteriota bacterium]
MSKFVVNIEEQAARQKQSVPAFGEYQKPKAKSRFLKIFGVLAAVLGAALLIGAIGGYFYWRSFQNTPQYSLALLIDAARRDDQAVVDQLVDTNAVVDDFMPQITGKAVELYGRGLPPQALSRVARVAEPILPAVKDRAREELPRVIREKTDKFTNIPFAAIVLGADTYLDISTNGDNALVKSKIPDRPLELKMKRNGDTWQVIGVNDEQLATRIAQKIGQEIITIATKGGINKAGKTLGVDNLQDLLKQAENALQ